jgi:protein-disulfide isomerase
MNLGRLPAVLAGALALAACASPQAQSPPALTVVVPPALPPPAPAAAPVATRYPSEADGPVPILPTDPTWGSRTAATTIVFFGDFQCPFTARAVPTIRSLQDRYGSTDLRVVWKNEPLPFHPNARAAAEAAEAVRALGGSDAFWKFFHLAFENQAQLGAASYETWAESAGVNVSAFRELVQAHAGGAKVDADAALAKTAGTGGTPAFLINGVRVSGAQPEDKFVAVIDAEIAKAKDHVAHGTAPELVYLAMVKENFLAPESDTTSAAAETPEQWKVAIEGAPARGSDAALVTIVEFADYQCPFCRRAEVTLQTIRDTYGDKVRIVWRDHPLPFHPRAMPAAEVTREARAEKGLAGFWAVHDGLFAQQTIDDATLGAVAAAAHLDAAKVRRAIVSERYKDDIQKDADRAEGLEASGTPTFFINGWKLVGAQPFDKFRAMIDKEVARAEALVAGGTPRAALYEALIRDGRAPGSPPPHVAPAPAPKAAPAPTPPPAGGGSVVVSDLVIGTGPMVKDGDSVTVHYVGALDDGTVFDSSRNRGRPFSARIGAGQLIKGWDQGVPGMRVGGTRRLVIPASLAYGSRPMPKIPPNSNLTFEIELLSIP